MRVLVCGGRTFSNQPMLCGVLDELHERTPISCLIHGAQRGADALADAWAHYNRVPVYRFHAYWKKLGPAAGPLRNARMLEKGQPHLVIAFPGGRGTADMVRKAHAAGLPVNRVYPDGHCVVWLGPEDIEAQLMNGVAP